MADRVCEELATGLSLRQVCEGVGMPTMSTVFRWLTLHVEFSEMYTRAREVQAETMADEILSIADDGRNDTYVDDEGRQRTDQDVIARSRLRVDARKWLAAKLMPRKYGEKVENTLKGDANAPLAIERIERVIVDPKK
jgi:hypothetical protein